MMKKRYTGIALIALCLVALDQITKLATLELIPLGGSVEIIPGVFNLVHVQNRGAAFGFLNDPGIQWQFWLFTVTTCIAVTAIIWLARIPETGKRYLAGLGLILGGATGNYIDRARFRHVIDFLDFYIKNSHWPAFNFADIGICVGVGLVAISLLWPGKGKADNVKTTLRTG